MPLEDIRRERIEKLKKLRGLNRDPYPARTRRTCLIKEAIKKFSAFSKSKKKVRIAGRIMARREHGGSAFIDLQDESGKIQVYFKEDLLGGDYRLFLDAADIGDFMEAEGGIFKTKKGEITLEAKNWAMLAKSLRPLPEKWHGLHDTEERFRKRYLDILMNEEVRERFKKRSQIIDLIREFFKKAGFEEVETPMLQTIPGGALAKPFVTHHQALNLDLYLRIAPELYLKRLLVAGMEKIYEIGKSFRNEGIDFSHNPEFTMLECYAAYWDENDMIKFTENLILFLANGLKKKTYEFGGKTIHFKKPFGRIDFKDLLSRYALIPDYETQTRETLAARARQLGLEVDASASRGKIADEIYKKICRPYLVQPTFVINHPLDISPLAKSRFENPAEARRFQLVISGQELTNGFAELNDPAEQRTRFEEQEKMRGIGEEEAHRIDEDFVEALEYGMPPAAGLGVGIDRVVMLFTDAKNIREAVLFPTLRPR